MQLDQAETRELFLAAWRERTMRNLQPDALEQLDEYIQRSWGFDPAGLVEGLIEVGAPDEGMAIFVMGFTIALEMTRLVARRAELI